MTSVSLEGLHHHVRAMGGRDPNEEHRAATPLELLFDLTFVIAFGIASSAFAHAVAYGHYSAGFIGFGFASFAICWAWVNFSWFASAYDTDDWIFRVVTMTQMIGVLILAIGLPRMFSSLEEHEGHIDNKMMVVGYVVMRIALVLQWLRAAHQDPQRRRTCLSYAIGIALVQIGWVTQIAIDLSPTYLALAIGVLLVLEVTVPVLAERVGNGSPWHADHIVERHRLFAIIALGEGVVGTVASMSAAIEASGWTLDAVLVCVAGVGLTFGMWWIYLIIPSARALKAHRDWSFGWTCGQMLLVTSIVATGAGLHVAAYVLEGKATIGAYQTLLATAIPAAIYVATIYALYYYCVRRSDPFHWWLIAITGALVATAVIAASLGVSMPVSLFVLMLAPVVTIVGYEWKGHRHQLHAATG